VRSDFLSVSTVRTEQPERRPVTFPVTTPCFSTILTRGIPSISDLTDTLPNGKSILSRGVPMKSPARFGRFLLLIALANLAATTHAQQTAPPGQKYALLVGVRKYKSNDLRTLNYPEADVNDLSKVLLANGYRPENVVVMTQSAVAEDVHFLPSAENIRKELDLLAAGRTPGDTFVVAFAGHGVQYGKDEENYFCPIDADLNDRSTLISLDSVYKLLEKSPAGFKLLLVDACRNNPLTQNSRSREVVDLASVTRPQLKQPPGGVAALFSCSVGEKSYEYPDLKHGVFFHFVIEALGGTADYDRDRRVSLEEISLYAKSRVSDYVRSHLNESQMPECIGQDRGLAPIVVLSGAAQARPASELHGVLGVSLKNLTPGVAGRLGIGAGVSGVLVDDVLWASPADLAELRRDDYLTSLDGESIDQDAVFARAASRFKPGSSHVLTYLRDGRKHSAILVTITFEELSRRLLRLDPKEAAAFRRRGLAFLTLDNTSAAIADLDKAVRLDPADASSQAALGKARLAANDLELAIAALTESIRLNPSEPRTLLDRARAFRAKGKIDAAMADLDEAIRLDPDQAIAFRNRAQLWYALKDSTRALADYDETIRLDPHSSSTLNSRGLIHGRQKNEAQAISDFSEAIRLDPNYVFAYGNRALHYLQAREPDRALADLDEAIHCDPKYAHGYCIRGQAWSAGRSPVYARPLPPRSLAQRKWEIRARHRRLRCGHQARSDRRRADPRPRRGVPAPRPDRSGLHRFRRSDPHRPEGPERVLHARARTRRPGPVRSRDRRLRRGNPAQAGRLEAAARPCPGLPESRRLSASPRRL
jgi:tetratricopeptide (TPR) repeat protein